ncbi:hypothetical protein HBH56_099610 [Parastagonospora nodorum]|uniref:Uncharacterized protein n=1 Tax=Phaeosphaeria nodorum (strain SN15 / ATCC MYA-4574 / FGSC 10173) TaxID=321614 RepID=A0A7U2ICV0_PHANO|nr:hypothetical protein HBH56_099610 [Parastagonospora nodorum]QRD07463.1 hypothetical protein JI435_131450 [Parastagonospora nodorum SN15]KAH3930569.1 hypothetical protein HBH54_113930 [Parastagonospora nodorum]KAH3942824.1 hypothetical protein HBH53_182040 [Parastagonospora nodorum]KAH3964624.1 hypothetical protein HBH51_158150 [Parastagonospora nodorum]
MASFTNLPPEIRNACYDELLSGENNSQHRIPHELAMFSVSKLVHEESSSYFYQHNVIAVDIPSATTDIASILPPIADKYLRYLKRLHLHALTGPPTLQQTHQAATAIAALACVGARFDELNLFIGSRLSHVLNSRVDDSIMGGSHPITTAIRNVLLSNVAKVYRIALESAWFAPGVAQTLQAEFGACLEFYSGGTPAHDFALLERQTSGRYSSAHLSSLGLTDEETSDMQLDANSISPASTPSSLPSSLCSAFADLDTFSVSSFELGSDGKEDEDCDESFANDIDTSQQPFFTEDDIEEWSAFAQEEQENGEDVLDDLEGLDGDDEMEDVSQEESRAFMRNLKEVAHHIANDEDVTYMTNFAPDLLLSRHHLGHLV